MDKGLHFPSVYNNQCSYISTKLCKIKQFHFTARRDTIYNHIKTDQKVSLHTSLLKHTFTFQDCFYTTFALEHAHSLL
jgi:hypothetical protein